MKRSTVLVFAALALGACKDGGGGAAGTETETGTGSDDSADDAPGCTADAQCGDCEMCNDMGVCVANPDACGDTGPECTTDDECAECQVCDAGVCIDAECPGSSDGGVCDDDTWCREGVSWCVAGSCVDVPEPTAAAACEGLGEPTLVEIAPQIQNRAVHWAEINGDGIPDIVSIAAGSLNAWASPDWAQTKTALDHEGLAMAVITGAAQSSVVEAGPGGEARVGLHTIAAAGSYTAVATLGTDAEVVQIVAFDADGDGVDEAAARTDDGIVSVIVEGDGLASGGSLFEGAAHDMAVLRTEGGDKLVVARDEGRTSVVELDDAGEAVRDDAGLTNPWGADLVVAIGGKYGVVGNGHAAAGALALPEAEPLTTLAVPAGALSAASIGIKESVFAIGGAEALAVFILDEDGKACELSIPAGPTEGVALVDLGEGALGVAAIVAGEMQLYGVPEVFATR